MEEEIKKLTEEVRKLREAVERLPVYMPTPYMPAPPWPHNPLWPTVTYGANTTLKC